MLRIGVYRSVGISSELQTLGREFQPLMPQYRDFTLNINYLELDQGNKNQSRLTQFRNLSSTSVA